MTVNRRRYTLLDPPHLGLWSRVRRLWARLRGQAPDVSTAPVLQPENVDFSLRHQVAVRAVRTFIERVSTYTLEGRRGVHVISTYEVPTAAGLDALVPEWLAHRVRFGVVDAKSGATRWVPIRAVDVVWGEGTTELHLQLMDKIEPGTRSFPAAWLGEESYAGLSEPPEVLQGN